ncbi:thiamine pyrophosphate-dependent enzyme [Streptomyces sp. NPDC054813]
MVALAAQGSLRRIHKESHQIIDLVAYAGSFGARGYAIEAADQLLPVLRRALDDDTVSVIACPVDYSENLRLTDRLGSLHGPF